MSSDIVILEAISSLCALAALAVFVHWLNQRVSASFRSGQALLQNFQTTDTVWIEKLPMAGRIIDLSVALLPAVEHWRRENKYGVPKYLADLDARLIRAGIRPRVSPEQFLSLNILAAVLIGGTLAILFALMGAGLFGGLFLGFLPGALLGSALPTMVLRNLVLGRISLIQKRLPFAIEFMQLAMESNPVFARAVEVYCMQMPDDPLADEFRLVLSDLHFNMSPQTALSRMAQRLDIDDLTAFVVAVNTGLEMGQQIKEVLQIQADATRQRRFESAERVAKTASTRAIFPLFIVAIAVMLLLIGPLAIRLFRENLF